MFHKPSLRTYERKTASKTATKFYKSAKIRPASRKTVRLDKIDKDKNGKLNDSLNYDPFDTTFDRVAKDAKLPVPLAEASNNNSYYSSSCDSSYEQIKRSKLPLELTISLPDISIQPVKEKRLRKKKQINVTKGTLIRATALKRNNQQKQLKGRSTKAEERIKKTKKISVSNENQQNLHENLCDKIIGSYNQNNIKPCSVVLTRLTDSTLVNNELLKKSEGYVKMKKTCPDDRESKEIKCAAISNCFVKIDNLEISLNTKDLNCKGKNTSLISSTPIGKLAKKISYFVPASPIVVDDLSSNAIDIKTCMSEESAEILEIPQKHENIGKNKVIDLLNIYEETNRSQSLFDNTISSTDISVCSITSNKSKKETFKNLTDSSTDSFAKKDRDKVYIKESYVLLQKLGDSGRITERRKRYQDWDHQIIDSLRVSNEKSISKNIENISNILQERKSIFLKPGKSWIRSLSMLKNIQNEHDLERLCNDPNKGKRWRHSLKDVLHMQKKGIVQSCIEGRDNEKTSVQSFYEISNGSQHILNGNKCNKHNSQVSTRFSKRVSIRVVPNTTSSTCIEDNSLLKVYGISTDKRLINLRNSSIGSIQSHDVDCQTQEDVKTAKEVVLQMCSQLDYLPFSECFSDIYLKYCRKIGEGVYGEVFLHEHRKQKSVIKIIPIEGNKLVNGEHQKKFHEILTEIVIAKELHDLRFNSAYNTDAFVEVKTVKCIIGRYPEKLIKLWQMFDEEKTSDNDCPLMFDDDQLYISLELGHGGQDLEAFVFQTAEETCAIFLQTALALAVAENAFEFEHRDLHWGNILISATDEPFIYYKLEDKEIKLPSKGVKVAIIDFTLSRMLYRGCCIFNDLALDPALFTAQGEYQFEIYRLMQDKVRNNWQTFQPYTNILWLHYVLDKMITGARYKKKTLRLHKNSIQQLKEFKSVILSYESSYDFVINCDIFVNL